MKKTKLGGTDQQVSEFCLGTMYFGSRVDEKKSFEIMDYYYNAGGRNFDTSNNYCFWLEGFVGDESEKTVGKWIKERNNREELFLATKCGARPIDMSKGRDNLEFEGLSKEVILTAIEGSLERLQTTYIDLYYVHVDWRREPLEETLEALNSLVVSGKVKHIACSNMDTWRMVKAKEICRKNGWAEFTAIQQWYSYLKPRDKADLWVQKFVSEELLDYCETEKDLTIFAYTGTLGGIYNWDTIYDKNHPALNNRFFSEDNERRFSILKKVAEKNNISPFQAVFAWMFKQNAHIIPILGVSKIEQLKDNLQTLEFELSDDDFILMENAAFNQKSYLDEKEVSLV